MSTFLHSNEHHIGITKSLETRPSIKAAVNSFTNKYGVEPNNGSTILWHPVNSRTLLSIENAIFNHTPWVGGMFIDTFVEFEHGFHVSFKKE